MKVGTTRSGKPVILKLSERGFEYDLVGSNSFDREEKFDVLAILQYLAIRELRRLNRLGLKGEVNLFEGSLRNWENEMPTVELDKLKAQMNIKSSIELVRLGRKLCDATFRQYLPGY